MIGKQDGEPRNSLAGKILTVTVKADPDVGWPPLVTILRVRVLDGVSPYLISWKYGDGKEDNQGPQAQHTYTSKGKFTATATILDSAGQTGQGSVDISIGQIPDPKDVKIYIRLASFQNGLVNVVGKAENLTQDTDIAGFMAVKIFDPNGILVSSQRTEIITLLKGENKSEGFIYKPSGNGLYKAILEFWADPDGENKLETDTATIPVQL